MQISLLCIKYVISAVRAAQNTFLIISRKLEDSLELQDRTGHVLGNESQA